MAANFTAPAEQLGAAFAEETGHRAVFSFGATGQLYAQIMQGAPFGALLSADAATPARLIAEGAGVEGTAFTYAVGRLALFSSEAGRVTGLESLGSEFNRLAIAESATAPYGAAALEVIEAAGLEEALAGKLVIGQNIAQAFQFVATGNAEMGLVALSQVIGLETGSVWVVDASLHAPIAQDAVLLDADDAAAAAFLEFLGGNTARAIISRHGYKVSR